MAVPCAVGVARFRCYSCQAFLRLLGNSVCPMCRLSEGVMYDTGHTVTRKDT